MYQVNLWDTAGLFHDFELWWYSCSGTDEERGIISWVEHVSSSEDDMSTGQYSTYDLPFCMPTLRRWTFTKYIPICPTFNGLAGKVMICIWTCVFWVISLQELLEDCTTVLSVKWIALICYGFNRYNFGNEYMVSWIVYTTTARITD